MSELLNGKPTINFWIISGAALAWNLIGMFFYVQQVTITPEMLATLTEVQQNFFIATPTWATAAFWATLETQTNIVTRSQNLGKRLRSGDMDRIIQPTMSDSDYDTDTLTRPNQVLSTSTQKRKKSDKKIDE